MTFLTFRKLEAELTPRGCRQPIRLDRDWEVYYEIAWKEIRTWNNCILAAFTEYWVNMLIHNAMLNPDLTCSKLSYLCTKR